MSFFVIPAKAGIQCFQKLITDLDPGFRRGDDFLRDHQFYDKLLSQWLYQIHISGNKNESLQIL